MTTWRQGPKLVLEVSELLVDPVEVVELRLRPGCHPSAGQVGLEILALG